MQKKFISGKPYIIPPRPETLKKVIDALSKKEVDIDEVVSILQKDVSLFAAVIATANTPLFSSGGQTSNLKQSVMRLGFSKMVTILRIVALKTALSKVGRLDNYWSTATEIARLTVQIMQRVSSNSIEEAYSLGMMHNCGITLMMEAIPEYRQFIEHSDANDLGKLIDLEKKHYRINHFQVSTEIAKRWLMPESVIQAIRLQSGGLEQAALDNHHNEDIKMLYCALVLAKDISLSYHNYWRLGEQIHPLETLEPALHFIGLSETDYLDLRESCLQALESQ